MRCGTCWRKSQTLFKVVTSTKQTKMRKTSFGSRPHTFQPTIGINTNFSINKKNLKTNSLGFVPPALIIDDAKSDLKLRSGRVRELN